MATYMQPYASPELASSSFAQFMVAARGPAAGPAEIPQLRRLAAHAVAGVVIVLALAWPALNWEHGSFPPRGDDPVVHTLGG